MYHAVPVANAGDVAGAYVSCWARASSIDDARSVAEAEIVESGWMPTDLIESGAVARDMYENDHGSLALFDQALVDNIVCVYHCYPHEDDAT